EAVSAGNLLAVAGGQQHRQLREAVAHLLHELNSADPARHDDVREDQRRLVAARELLERLRGAVRDSAFKSELAEHSGGKLGNEGVVLDDQRPTEWGPGPGPG